MDTRDPHRDRRVDILVPTYNASAFIDRTLMFARGQTHRDISIIVSIDKSDDDTTERVRRHAEGDARISVIEQTARRGWAGNINDLLDRVTAPYHFIYFHDDIIVPQYTERLLAVLEARPDAAMAFCAVAQFGGRDDTVVGRSHEGSAAHRFLTLLLAPDSGAPLRGLMRTERVHGVRLPENGLSALWANQPFLLRILATGPALYEPAELYIRWTMREGGVTHGWRKMDMAEAIAGLEATTRELLAIAESTAASTDERSALMLAVQIEAMRHARRIMLDNGGDRSAFRVLQHPDLQAEEVPASMAEFGLEIDSWARDHFRKLMRAISADPPLMTPKPA